MQTCWTLYRGWQRRAKEMPDKMLMTQTQRQRSRLRRSQACSWLPQAPYLHWDVKNNHFIWSMIPLKQIHGINKCVSIEVGSFLWGRKPKTSVEQKRLFVTLVIVIEGQSWFSSRSDSVKNRFSLAGHLAVSASELLIKKPNRCWIIIGSGTCFSRNIPLATKENCENRKKL